MVIRGFLITIICFTSAFGQRVDVIKYPRLQALIDATGDDIHVINFWATWCGPCIKELPQFEALHQKNAPGVKVTLISLDFADQVGRVERFLQRKKMTAPTLLLDEIDGNSWIDKVEPAWSGAIPATLILNQRTGKRKFIEKELKEGELESLLEEFIGS
jgi:thiol-disulfide isomerase/thioredoxin